MRVPRRSMRVIGTAALLCAVGVATGTGVSDPPVASAAPIADPSVDGDGTAATAFDWGPPLPTSDEFDYTGAPDPARWRNAPECWPGHAHWGRRCGSRSTVADGYLRLAGLANGDTGWLRHRTDQKYGRWEARIRVGADAPEGFPYHPVLLLWPKSGLDPSGGEYDIAENDVGSPLVKAYIHHPTQTGLVQDRFELPIDMTQWHTFALDWGPGHVTGYVDGVLWFDDTDPAVQAPGPMHGNIQLDNFSGRPDLQAAHMDVDWYRVYPAG